MDLTGTPRPRRIVAGPVVLELHGPDRAAEIADLVNANLAHLAVWMPWAHRPTTVQEQAMRLAMVVEQADTGGDVVWSIVDRTGAIVGASGLHHGDQPDTLDIGYWLATSSTGRGYVTAAAGALTQVAFEVFGVGVVRITCDEANVRSAAVPRRLGFDHAHTLDEPRDAPGDTNRTMVWVMTPGRWMESPGSRIAVSYA